MTELRTNYKFDDPLGHFFSLALNFMVVDIVVNFELKRLEILQHIMFHPENIS